MRLSVCLLFVCAVPAGCAAPLPQYDWRDEVSALNDLANRAAAVQTIEATCSLTLRDEQGERIALDGAMAAHVPDHLRLRAWKLHHVAFDLTMTPTGVWLKAHEDVESQREQYSLGEGFRQAWGLVSGSFLRRSLKVASRSRDHQQATLIEAVSASDRFDVICIVDTGTLTPRRYEVRGRASELMYAVDLDRYAMQDGIIWPRRIVFEGPAGTMTIDVDDVEFNGELAAGAFTPPRDAVRQP